MKTTNNKKKKKFDSTLAFLALSTLAAFSAFSVLAAFLAFSALALAFTLRTASFPNDPPRLGPLWNLDSAKLTIKILDWTLHRSSDSTWKSAVKLVPLFGKVS